MARRGRGEGSIFRRKDRPGWVAQLAIGTTSAGRTRYWTRYAKTRREAAGLLATAIEQHRRGIDLDADKQTVAEFVSDWLENSAKQTVRPTTYFSYESKVRLHIIPRLGHFRLGGLKAQNVQRWINELQNTGLSPRTIQFCHAILRRALNQALRWGLITRNVATLVDVPTPTSPEIVPLTVDQARHFMDSISDHRLYALYALALTLGLRQSELIGLRWQDVDLDRAQIRIASTLHRARGQWFVAQPKSRTSQRVLPLPRVAIQALHRHRIRALEEQIRREHGRENAELVFTDERTGEPIKPTWLGRELHRLLKAAGLPKIRFHDLRHTAASLLLAEGRSAREIMEVLGHSTFSLTMDTYSHVMPALLKESADAMDRILGDGEPPR